METVLTVVVFAVAAYVAVKALDFLFLPWCSFWDAKQFCKNQEGWWYWLNPLEAASSRYSIVAHNATPGEQFTQETVLVLYDRERRLFIHTRGPTGARSDTHISKSIQPILEYIKTGERPAQLRV